MQTLDDTGEIIY